MECKKRAPFSGLSSDCRKTYITKRVVRPTPINPQKAATCAWLFALCKGGAPRWSGGRTAILSLVRWPDDHTFFGPVSGRPYFLCFSAYNRPGAGAQYGSGGTPPAPCKNSKKWPKPLFRHAEGKRRMRFPFLILLSVQALGEDGSPFLQGHGVTGGGLVEGDFQHCFSFYHHQSGENGGVACDRVHTQFCG